MQSQYKIGLIGFGRLGMMQVEYLLSRPKWRLIGVADTSKMAFARFQQKYHDLHIPFFATAVDLLDYEEYEGMDAILVSTTAPSHVEIAKNIIESGFLGAILVEKPISTSVNEARSLLKIINKKAWKGKIGVDYSRRCSAMYCEINRLISSGDLGRLVKVQVNRSGRISMNGSHFIDLAVFLTHSKPSRVSARLSSHSTRDYRGAYYFDPYGHITVVFQNRAALELNMKSPHERVTYEEDSVIVICENGEIRIDSQEEDAFIKAPMSKAHISSDRKEILTWFENTLEALITGKSRCTPCTLEESIDSLEVIVAAFASDRLGDVVDMPLDNALCSEVLRIA